MVWAAISADHRSDLVFIDGKLNAVRYRDEMLGPIVLPFLEWVGGRAVFQHDNARPHVARACTYSLMENEVHRSRDTMACRQSRPESHRKCVGFPEHAKPPTNYAAVEGCTGERMDGHTTAPDPTLLQVHEATDYAVLDAIRGHVSY